MRTLKSGTHNLVFTQAVNDRMAEDATFAKLVYASLVKFNHGDWGCVAEDSWEANDADTQALNRDEGGRVLAEYVGRPWPSNIWIIRDSVAITVLFPSEY
jgi:hypothetical protein